MAADTVNQFRLRGTIPKANSSNACATRYGTVVRQLEEHFLSVSWILATTPKMYRPRLEMTKENGYAN
jgi:hypothetical protein